MKVIHFISLQRCGTHAIMNWLLHQNKKYDKFEHPVHIENDVWSSQDGTAVLFNSVEFWWENIGKQVDVIKKNNLKPQTLIVGYETGNLNRWSHDRFNNDIENIFGTGYIRFNILNLRDVQNVCSSFIKRYRTVPEHIIPQWRERAKELVGETNYVKNWIPVKYNWWFADKEYRQTLAKATLSDFTDLGINNVAKFGEGSSFDKTEYEGKAQEMNVLGRFHENEVLLPHFITKEDIELSNRIFQNV